MNVKAKERLTKFTQENAKLQKDVEELEEVLALHSQISKTDDSSVRGILRKEIGGSRWQHGTQGKLSGYKTSKQLSSRPGSGDNGLANRNTRSVSSKESKSVSRNEKQLHQNNSKQLTRNNKLPVEPSVAPSMAPNGDEQSGVLGSTYCQRIAEKKKKVLQKLAAEIDMYPSKQKPGSANKISIKDKKRVPTKQLPEKPKSLAMQSRKIGAKNQSLPDNVPSLWEMSSKETVINGNEELHVNHEVESWLRTLHLHNVEKYIKIFSENEIDLESVKLLSEDQLKEMGVTAMGPLNKLLFAIAEIRGEDLDNQILTARAQAEDTPRSIDYLSPRPTEGQVVKQKSHVPCRDQKAKSGTIKSKIVTEKRLHSQLWKTSSAKEPSRTESDPQKKTSQNVIPPKPINKSARLVSTGVDAAMKKTALQKKKQETLQKKEKSVSEAKKKARDEMAARHAARLAEALDIETAELARKYHEQLDAAKVENLEDVLNEVMVTNNLTGGNTRKKKNDVSKSKTVPKPYVEITGHKLDTPHRLQTPRTEDKTKPTKLERTKPLLDDLELLELKVKSLQEKGSDIDDTVSPNLINNLQQQLNSIQQQIRDMGTSDQHHASTTATSQVGTSKIHVPDRNQSVAKNRFHFKPGSKSPEKHAGSGPPPNMSLSKQELLKEVRKQKDDHRKHIRYLESELSRLKHKDPIKTCELGEGDIYYDPRDKLGEGAFSQVYKGTFQGTEVAVKRLKVPLVAQDKNYFAAEVSLLHELRHPRVVLLLGVCTKSEHPLMVLEFMAQGCLYSVLHDLTRPDLDHVAYYQIARDTALGMNYLHLHKPAVLHLDLKSMNVLLGSHGRAKIGDFGFSKLRHEAQSASQSSKSARPEGTPAWMAPELLDGGEVSTKADVYSYGVILWEMVTREQPYKGCSTYQVLERTRTNKRPDIPASCAEGLSSLIRRCWNPNPACRPAFKDIVAILEDLSFPREWQELFSAAGVPRDAMDDIQSARNIISLVNQTLDEEMLALSNPGTSRNHGHSISVLASGDLENSMNASLGRLNSYRQRLGTSRPDGVPSLNLMDSQTHLSTAAPKSTNRVHFSDDHDFDNFTYRTSVKPVIHPDLYLGGFKGQSDESEEEKFNLEDLNDPLSPKGKDGGGKGSAKTFRASAWHDELRNELAGLGHTSIPAPPPIPSQFNIQPANTKIEPSHSKTNKTKPKTEAGKTGNAEAAVFKSAELIQQRLRLQPTTGNHPSQLKDLGNIDDERMSSLAEILRKAVNDRRPAMTDRDHYSQGDSGWSVS